MFAGEHMHGPDLTKYGDKMPCPAKHKYNKIMM
jgi:hypothetical protein